MSKIRSIKMKILIMSTFNCNHNGLSMCYGAAQRYPINVRATGLHQSQTIDIARVKMPLLSRNQTKMPSLVTYLMPYHKSFARC